MARRTRTTTSTTSSTTGRHTQWREVPVDNRPQVDLLSWAGWLIGGELIVVALVALARAGFDDIDLFDPVVAVGPLHATRLMAFIGLALGLVIWTGTAGAVDAMGLRVVGALMLVAGIVWIIEPNGFAEWLGTERADGVHHAVVGLVLVVLALVPPFRVGRRPSPADT